MYYLETLFRSLRLKVTQPPVAAAADVPADDVPLSESDRLAIMEWCISMNANTQSMTSPVSAALLKDEAMEKKTPSPGHKFSTAVAVPVPADPPVDTATAPNVAPMVGAAPVITATSAVISAPVTSFSDVCVTDGTNAA